VRGRAGRHAYAQQPQEDLGDLTYERNLLEENRPHFRGDCLPGGRNAARPCPYARCRHNLLVDIIPNPSGGAPRVYENFPGVPPQDLVATCVLDVVDEIGEFDREALLKELGGRDTQDDSLALEQVGRLMNITRERVRQVQVEGLVALRVAFTGAKRLPKPETD